MPQRPVRARPLYEWCKVSLLATSKQIYAEALPLFYQDDTIWIPPARVSGQRLEMPTREACCLIRAVKLGLLCHTLELPVLHNGKAHFPLVHDSALVQKRCVGQLVVSFPNLTSLLLCYDSAWTFHHVLIDILRSAPTRLLQHGSAFAVELRETASRVHPFLNSHPTPYWKLDVGLESDDSIISSLAEHKHVSSIRLEIDIAVEACRVVEQTNLQALELQPLLHAPIVNGDVRIFRYRAQAR